MCVGEFAGAFPSTDIVDHTRRDMYVDFSVCLLLVNHWQCAVN